MPLTAEAKLQLMERVLTDPEFNIKYDKDKIEALNTVGVTDEYEITGIIYLIDILRKGACMTDMAMKSSIDTIETGDSFKRSIRQTLKQINSGYMVVMIMYALAFLTGIALIVAAIIMAVNKQENLLSIVFGSLGTMEILVFFFTKPAMHLQSSRTRHAQLEMGFYSWFVDVYNINSYLISLNGKLDNFENFERFVKVVDMQLVHTKETLKALQEFTAATEADQ